MKKLFCIVSIFSVLFISPKSNLDTVAVSNTDSLVAQFLNFTPEENYVKPKVKSGEHYVASMQLEGEIDVQSTKAFLKRLNQIEETKPEVIVIEFNSPGGMVGAGFLIAKAIEKIDIPVVCAVDGMAASMAYYILQSCDVRAMTKRSMLMAHAPLIPGIQMSGDQSKFKLMYERLHILTETMIYQYTFKTKISIEEMRKRCLNGGEWWMAWEEALKIGAVDAVIPSVKNLLTGFKKNGIQFDKN